MNSIVQEREKTHGPFSSGAQCAQQIKAALHQGAGYARLSAVHREALDMIATKLSRIVTGNADELDHWQDVSGYAELGANGAGLQAALDLGPGKP